MWAAVAAILAARTAVWDRSVGGRDRSGGGRDCSVGGRVADFVFRRRFSIADDGWDEANGGRTDGAMEQRAAANLERSVPAAVGVLESGFRVLESSTWQPTGSTSSSWANKKSKPRMGLYTAARKKVTKNVRSPNERQQRMVPHVGIDLPSAPESCGLAGCAFERCGRTLHTAPVSTMNCCLLSSSVAVGMVVVANVPVLLIRARGRRAVASVVGRDLPAAAAGNGVDGCFIARIDGGGCVAPPARVPLDCETKFQI
jgi:hypothetical protein